MGAVSIALADLHDAYARRHVDEDGIDWTRLRALLDHLGHRCEDIADAIADAPPPSGSDLLDSLLAGIAEKLADDAGLPRPPWTSRVPPMPDDWDYVGTPRMLAERRRTAPPQLAARRIWLDEGSLWRERIWHPVADGPAPQP